MVAPKPEDINHPPMEQLPGLKYCKTLTPWPETIILGLQHYILMLGNAVMALTFLVPAMGENDHDKTIFLRLLNTHLQNGNKGLDGPLTCLLRVRNCT